VLNSKALHLIISNFSSLANKKYLSNRWETHGFLSKIGLRNAELEEDLCPCGCGERETI
jgi:hypothetical protein